MCAFRAVENPDDMLIEQHCTLGGLRCHSSVPFIRAHTDPGMTVLWLALLTGDRLVAGAVGFLQQRGLLRTLRMPTLPVVMPGDSKKSSPFWSGIVDYCRSRRVVRLIMRSYEATPIVIPSIGRIRNTTRRCEYVVELEADADRQLRTFSQNHRRNIAKAEKNHLSFHLRRSQAAADRHAESVHSSARRRGGAGGPISPAVRERFNRIVDSGAGEFIQVEKDGKVLTSLLVLSTKTRAYYHSGGSAPEGTRLGASHYAMWRTMCTLRKRGVESLNLGGTTADDSEGLVRFKQGFHPTVIELSHMVFEMDVALPWRVLSRWWRS